MNNMKNIFSVILFLSFVFGFGQINSSPKENTKLTKENATVKNVDDNSNKVPTSVELRAQPKGGMAAFNRYVANSFVLPKAEKDTLASVLVKFIILEDGSVSNIQIVRESPEGLGLGNEAIRVLSNSAKWTPAQQNGKFVKQYFTLPLKLQLLGPEKNETPTELTTKKEETNFGTKKNNDEGQELEFIQVFSDVDVQAAPPGGMNAFRKYIATSFKLPPVYEKTIGTVVAKFVVWDDGSLRNIIIVKESPEGIGLGEEAKRVIANSAKWTPGIYNGRSVKQYFTLPMSFEIKPLEKVDPTQKK